jgi:hypothetical protein
VLEENLPQFKFKFKFYCKISSTQSRLQNTPDGYRTSHKQITYTIECPPQIPQDLTWDRTHYGGKLATNYLSYSTAYSPDIITSVNVTKIHDSYINRSAELRWNDMTTDGQYNTTDCIIFVYSCIHFDFLALVCSKYALNIFKLCCSHLTAGLGP